MKSTVAIVFGCVAGLVIGFGHRPSAGVLDDQQISGDLELGQRAIELAPDVGVHALGVGLLVDGEVRIASVNAPVDGVYEIGSVSKPLTGMLYTDAVERGEVQPETTLGELLELGDVPAAQISLESLSQQRSGLPRLPLSLLGMLQTIWASLTASNPYGEDNADLIDSLRSTAVGDSQTLYSNFGFASLGLAIAEAANSSFSAVLGERVAGPLGLESMTVAITEADLPPELVPGRDRAGRNQAAWVGEAYAPSGGVLSNVADMMTLAEALIDGSAAGSAAMEPVTDFSESQQIGAAWLTHTVDGQELTWHNGGTGGYRSYFAINLEAETAVFIVGATTESLDDVGQQLLLGASS